MTPRSIPAILLLLAATAAQATPGPEVVFDGELQIATGVPAYCPLGLVTGGHDVSAVVVSFDLDLDRVGFDSADGDGDGVPDGILFPLGAPEMVHVAFDAGDTDGELDILLANLSGLPFLDGLLLEIELLPAGDGLIAAWVGCSQNPPASFGDPGGQDIPGICVVTGAEVFADGFESGDLGTWTASSG